LEDEEDGTCWIRGETRNEYKSVRSDVLMIVSIKSTLFLDKKTIIFIQHFVYKNRREEMAENTGIDEINFS
jgi:hypothetical protein